MHYVVFAFALAAAVLFFAALFLGLLSFSARVSFADLLRDPELRAAAALTVWSTAASTVIACSAAVSCAYLLARLNFPGKALVETILEAPIVLPPLVSGVALLIFFGPVLGDRLTRFGIDVVYTPLGVVAAQAFIAFPFAVKMFRETFSTADPRYESLARTLGCAPIQVFFRVSLPLARRGIAAGIAMSWARTVGEFGATAMLAGVTRMRTETLSASVFLSMSVGELDASIAVSVALLACAFTVLSVIRAASSRRNP